MQSLAARKINVCPVEKKKTTSTDRDTRAAFKFLRGCKNLGTQYPLDWAKIIFLSQRLFDSDTGSILMRIIQPQILSGNAFLLCTPDQL